ncbi:MAG: hypothetical protein ACXAB2_03030 [Candidatus Hodarchaeales archaeon]
MLNTGFFFDSFSLERYSYVLATLGVVGDQISTRIGLLNPDIVEFNPIVRFLISVNAWFFFDLLVLGITIGTSYFFLRKVNVKYNTCILVYPILFGFLRLFVTVLNLQIILGI